MDWITEEWADKWMPLIMIMLVGALIFFFLNALRFLGAVN